MLKDYTETVVASVVCLDSAPKRGKVQKETRRTLSLHPRSGRREMPSI